MKRELLHDGRRFEFIENDECNCGNCIFNEMGAEGTQLCQDNDCNEEGYWKLKPVAEVDPDEIDWDKEMEDWRKELRKENFKESDVNGTFYDDLDKAELLQKNSEAYQKIISDETN